MNFDVYDLNKIFYEHIFSLPDRKKYGFRCWKQWDGPKYNCFFNVSLNFEAVSWIHYPSPYIDRHLMMKDHPHSYQIDMNYFFHWNEGQCCCFSAHGTNPKVSLRELVLFIIYMKHLYSCI